MREADSIAMRPDGRSQRRPMAGGGSRWVVAISVWVTFVVCYFRDFVLPNIPVMSWRDQMLFATNGTRIVAGQMPYRDYFQFVTPGTDLMYALLFRCLGVRMWIPGMAMVCLASAVVLLTMLAAGKVLRGAFLVLPAALTLGFVLYGGLDATHHWFSTVVAMAAMLVLLGGTGRWRAAVAGALCGVTASFTQSKGATVVLGFVVYLIWQSLLERERAGVRWRRCQLLCGAALVSFVAINARYMYALGIEGWIKWVIVFQFRFYPSIHSQSWRAPWSDFQSYAGLLKWICVPFLYAAVPLAPLVFLWVMHRRRREEPGAPWDQLLLIAITGLAMFLGVAPCLTLLRVSSAALPAMILMAWLLNRYGRPGAVAAGALAALSMAVAMYLPIRAQQMHWFYLDLPAGRTAILEPGKYELYRWMAEHTHPGQMYFGIVPLSLPLWLQCPAPIQAPGPWEYYRPEHIAASIDAIEENRVALLVLRPTANFVGTWGYEADHLRSFDAYIDGHYRRIKSFSTGDEVWERKDMIGADLVP